MSTTSVKREPETWLSIWFSHELTFNEWPWVDDGAEWKAGLRGTVALPQRTLYFFLLP